MNEKVKRCWRSLAERTGITIARETRQFAAKISEGLLLTSRWSGRRPFAKRFRLFGDEE